MLLALPIVWLVDAGAYLVGTRLGRHKLAPRLSPHKTWEGYFGGVIFGVLGGTILGGLIFVLNGSATAINPLRGAMLGLVLAVLTPLGDLGESLIKRQVGAKDSGDLLPGHGGVFDRIDSWLWAGVLGFYFISFVFRIN